VIPTPIRAFKKLHSLVMERCCAERPEQSQGSRFVAGESFTLDGGKGFSAMGFERGNEGFKTRREQGA
jgi:hypothetical protein